MRTRNPTLVLATVIAIFAVPALAQSLNPKAVAQLRWYPFNQGTNFDSSIGGYLYGAGFDGQNLWLSAASGIVKMRPTDGAILGTYANAPGSANVRGFAFDGVNMWTANSSSNISKRRASDGADLGEFDTYSNPKFVLFDSTNIIAITEVASNWVLRYFRPSDGHLLRQTPISFQPTSAYFDGSNTWICGGQLEKLSSTGTVLKSFSLGPTAGYGMTYDGSYLWVAGNNSSTGASTVYKVDPRAETIISTFPLSQNGAGAIGFDGENIWVATAAGFVKLRPSDGVVVESITTISGSPILVFDGANMWGQYYGGPSQSILFFSKL